MKIEFEKEVLDFLNIPSIPLKEWNGKDSFKDGVAVVSLMEEREAYAVATFNAETDDKPRIRKVFSQEPFFSVKEIFVVPSYMDVDNIDDMDLDKESKEAAHRLAEEAEELENNGVKKTELPDNEWYFDNIHNDEEALAFIKTMNQKMKIKGKLPKNHDAIVARLGVLWRDLQKKNK